METIASFRKDLALSRLPYDSSCLVLRSSSYWPQIICLGWEAGLARVVLNLMEQSSSLYKEPFLLHVALSSPIEIST